MNMQNVPADNVAQTTAEVPQIRSVDRVVVFQAATKAGVNCTDGQEGREDRIGAVPEQGGRHARCGAMPAAPSIHG